jgi:nucleotide-binding universal stress UspA family protein
MAVALEAELILLYVLEMGYGTLRLLNADAMVEPNLQLGKKASEALAAFVAERAELLPSAVVGARRMIAIGEAAREIELCALNNDVDLIVMGSHGRTGFQRWYMGSVAERVVRIAPCPVMTVPLKG